MNLSVSYTASELFPSPPASQTTQHSPNPVVNSVTAEESAKEPLLLLDDDPSIIDALPLALEPEFEAIGVLVVPAAMEKLASNPHIKFAIVDTSFGPNGEDSFDHIYAISRLPHKPKVIVYTADGSEEKKRECRRNGAIAYVQKSNEVVQPRGGGEPCIASILKLKEIMQDILELEAMDRKRAAQSGHEAQSGNRTSAATIPMGEAGLEPGQNVLVEDYRGRVNSVRENTAHVTLVDQSGRETLLDCDAAELASRGIYEGTDFRYTIHKQGDDYIVALRPIPRRFLSPERIQAIYEETERDFGAVPSVDDN